MSNIQYRKDIDGLRGIAVLAVVLFHAFPTIFKGGYIGVDLFFVISGYLISSIIFTSLEQNNFSYSDFYIRRLRRLFPALIVAFVVVLTGGYFFLYSDEFAQFGKHLFSGSLFFSNWTLFHEIGYFDRAAETKPLLHLWSLSIEEQFYLLWPAVVVYLYRRQQNIFKWVVGFFFISLSLNLFLSQKWGSFNFYFPLSRFWEILAGTWLAVVVTLRKKRVESRFVNYFSVFALLMFLGLVFSFDRNIHFPGWRALFPVMSAVFLIAYHNSFVHQKILESRFLVYFGHISFPLYLWHWPLLAFANLTYPDHVPVYVRGALVLVAVVLSDITYRLVENPIRIHKKVSVATLVSAMSIVALIGFVIYQFNGFSFRYTANENEFSNRKYNYENKGAFDCQSIQDPSVDFFCGSSDKRPTTLIWGDSHAAHLLSGFNQRKQTLESIIPVVMLAGSSCQPFNDSHQREFCQLLNSRILQYVKNQSEVKNVILSSYYGYFNQDSERIGDHFKAWVSLIEQLIQLKKNVFIVIDGPTFVSDVQSCVHTDLFLREKLQRRSKLCDKVSVDQIMDRRSYEKMMLELKNRFIENNLVHFFDSYSVLCPNGECAIQVQGKILYTDNNHLSHFGSFLISKDLERFVLQHQ